MADGEWAVGDCAGPDPEAPPDGYRLVDCAGPGATATVTAVGPVAVVDEPECPPGTDVIIEVMSSFGSGTDGFPAGTACLRNLAPPHPGDPGNGGGQLLEGDCINATGSEILEIPCGPGALEVLALLEQGAPCPDGTTDPVELTVPNNRFGLICGLLIP